MEVIITPKKFSPPLLIFPCVLFHLLLVVMLKLYNIIILNIIHYNTPHKISVLLCMHLHSKMFNNRIILVQI